MNGLLKLVIVKDCPHLAIAVTCPEWGGYLHLGLTHICPEKSWTVKLDILSIN
jgi:hypothetical protein